MLRALLRDGSLYTATAIAGRMLSLLTVPIFTRYLTPADYGVVDLLTYLALFVPLLVGLALDQAVARFYADAPDDEERRRIASTVLLYFVFGLLLVALLAMMAADVVATGLLHGETDVATVRMAMVFLWLNAVFFITNNQLKYMFKARLYALSNLGNAVVGAVLAVAFLSVGEMGVLGVFLAQSASLALFTLVSLFAARSAYRIVFHLATLRRLLQYSLPLVPATVAFFVMQYVDRYVISELRGLEEVGLYGIGARVAGLVNLILWGFQSAWYPLIMRNHASPDTPRQVATIFSYYVLATGTMLVLVSLFAPEILRVLTTPDYYAAYQYVPLLIAAAVLCSIANYFSFGLQIARKSMQRMYINLAVIVVNIAAAVLLVQQFGAMGAAIAAFISFSVLAVVSLGFSQRYYAVPYRWGAVLSAGAVAILGAHLVLVFPETGEIVWLPVKLLVAASAGFLMSVLLGIQLTRDLSRCARLAMQMARMRKEAA